jgi:hypothetical protein
MATPGNARRSVRAAKRLYPLALEAYRRWSRLSPKEKERYKKAAQSYAKQSAGYARQAASKVPRGPFRGRPPR